MSKFDAEGVNMVYGFIRETQCRLDGNPARLWIIWGEFFTGDCVQVLGTAMDIVTMH